MYLSVGISAKKKRISVGFFFFGPCSKYTQRTFRCFLSLRLTGNTSFEWSPKSRGVVPTVASEMNPQDSLRSPDFNAPPFLSLRFSRFIPFSRGLVLAGFPQITRICLATLTFLAQQISIIAMKSGRGSSAKSMNGENGFSCIVRMQFASKFYPHFTNEEHGNCLRN